MAVDLIHDYSRYESVKQEEISKLRRGDHLAVEGTASGVIYLHHGIFLGHDKGVADLFGEDKRRSKVQIRDIPAFTDSFRRKLFRIGYDSYQCLSNKRAAEKAEQVAMNYGKWSDNDLIDNNCEHFATFCKIGGRQSVQVFKRLFGKGMIVLAVAIVIGLFWRI